MKDVFLYPLENLEEYNELLNQINSSGNIVTSGLINSQNTHIIYSLFENLKKQIIFVTSSDLEAKKVYEDLNVYIPVYIEYLAFDVVLFYHLDAKDRTQDAKKLKVLMRLINNENFVLVTSVEAILKKYIPKDILAKNIYDYKVSDTINIDEFNKKLVELGYERVSKVEGFGQFSIRGGIIDIFSLQYSNPIRIELFDDEIESIRIFDVFSQKSVKKIDNFTLIPSRDFIYPLDIDLSKIKSELTKNTDEDILDDIEKISSKIYFEGIENYIDYMYKEENKSIFSYMKEHSLIFCSDISRSKERCINYLNEFKDNYNLNLERGLALKTQGELLYEFEHLEYLINDKKVILNTLLPKKLDYFNVKHYINFECREVITFNKNINLLSQELNSLKSDGYKIVIATNTYERAEKLHKELFD